MNEASRHFIGKIAFAGKAESVADHLIHAVMLYFFGGSDA